MRFLQDSRGSETAESEVRLRSPAFAAAPLRRDGFGATAFACWACSPGSGDLLAEPKLPRSGSEGWLGDRETTQALFRFLPTSARFFQLLVILTVTAILVFQPSAALCQVLPALPTR